MLKQIKDISITKTVADDSDFLIMQSPTGETYKITKGDLLAGLSGSAISPSDDVLFASTFQDLTDIKGHTITGSAIISTADKYFGNSSLYCDGSASSYISIAANLSEFNLTGDFTFDTFLKFTSLGGNNSFLPFLEIGNPDAGGLRVGWFNNSGGKIQLVINGSAYYFNWSPSMNTWYYFSLERQAASLSVKVNATQIGSNSINALSITGSSSILIGGTILDTGQRMLGYFDNTRLRKFYANIAAIPATTF